MSSVTMRFTGWQEDVMDRLVRSGIVESKAEALRLALFKLAADYELVDSPTLLHVLQGEREKRGLSMEKILESVEHAKTATIRR